MASLKSRRLPSGKFHQLHPCSLSMETAISQSMPTADSSSWMKREHQPSSQQPRCWDSMEKSTGRSHRSEPSNMLLGMASAKPEMRTVWVSRKAASSWSSSMNHQFAHSFLPMWATITTKVSEKSSMDGTCCKKQGKTVRQTFNSPIRQKRKLQRQEHWREHRC